MPAGGPHASPWQLLTPLPPSALEKARSQNSVKLVTAPLAKARSQPSLKGPSPTWWPAICVGPRKGDSLVTCSCIRPRETPHAGWHTVEL